MAAPRLVTVTENQRAELVQLPVDTVMVIELDSNISTGHSWQIQSDAEKSWRHLGSEYVHPEEQAPGVWGKERIYLVGERPGVSSIELDYKRFHTADVVRALSFEIASQGQFVEEFSVPEPEVYTPPKYVPTRKDLPERFNWCDNDACTPARSQGSCGSCWAFATAAPLEQLIKIMDGNDDINLSEQYLVSCNNDGWDCGGGWWAHNWHMNKKLSSQEEAGATLEEVKPYTESNGSCGVDYPKSYRLEDWGYAGDSSYDDTPVDDIKDAIFNYGPVTVATCAGNGMSSYSGGVWTGPGCSSINHAVALTGWDDNGGNGYWYMRNSWGASWGEDGYMRIGYGVSRIGYNTAYVIYAGTDPRLAVSGLKNFQVITGEGDPAPQTVSVRNMGADVMNWSVTCDASWLTINPTSGMAPTDVTVTASAAGLSNGTHTANLTFISPEAVNSPLQVQVSLNIVEVPRIVVPYSSSTPTVDGNISSGEYDDAVVVDLDPDNPGQFLAWIKNDGQDMYFAVDAVGDTDNDSYDVFAVYFDLDNNDVWPSSPQDEGRFYIFSNGNLSYYPIYNQGEGYEAGSKVSNPTGLSGNFGESSGHRVVETRIDMTSSKMNVSPGDTFGMYLMYYDSVSGDFDIIGTWPSMVDTRDHCLYFGNTTVGQDGVVPEDILVSPGSLSFQGMVDGSQTSPQTLNISTSQSGNLTYSALASDSWIKLASTSGTTPASLGVWTDPSGLAAGSYNGTVTISAPQSSNGTVVVSVSFVVDDQGTQPDLMVTPLSLSFLAVEGGSATAPVTLNLNASDGSNLGYGITPSASWIKLASTSGSTPGTVGVWADPTGYSPGTLTGNLTINAPGSANGSVMVAVTFVIEEDQPQDENLLVSPASLSYQAVQNGSATSPVSMNVNASAGGNLSYSITVTHPWIKLSGTGGTTPAMVAVWADPAGLPPGTHTGTVTVSAPQSGNGMVAVPVTFVVEQDQPQPEDILVAPASLGFTGIANGEVTPPLNLNVTASRGGALNFGISTTETWLRLSAPSGVTPNTITVSADPRGLPVGVAQGTITVNAPQSGNLSVIVQVAFTVEEEPDPEIPPDLDVEPKSISFDAVQNGINPLPQAVSVINRGGGTLMWSATLEGNWFTLDSYSGACPSSVQVIPTTTNLPAGATHGAVIFAAPDQEPVRVELWITITEQIEENLPPSAPVPVSPVNMAKVSGTNQELVVQNAADPEGKALTYYFEVYLEGTTENPVWFQAVPGGTGITTAIVNQQLLVETSYWWRAKAIDDQNAHGPWSAAAHFIVAEPVINGGCACSTGNSRGASALMLLGLLLGLCLYRRKSRG